MVSVDIEEAHLQANNLSFHYHPQRYVIASCIVMPQNLHLHGCIGRSQIFQCHGGGTHKIDIV